MKGKVMELTDFIKSGMVVLIPGLYFVGIILKNSSVSDWLIPFILGILGIAMSFLWHIGSEGVLNAGIIFDSITQGLLCAAGSVYVKNLAVQFNKREEEK